METEIKTEADDIVTEIECMVPTHTIERIHIDQLTQPANTLEESLSDEVIQPRNKKSIIIILLNEIILNNLIFLNLLQYGHQMKLSSL